MKLADSISAERLKVLTTRMWWVLGLIAFGYLAFMGLTLGATFSFVPEEAGPPLAGGALARMVYSTAVTLGYVFPLLAGALSVTGEYRHQTLTPTFLAMPRRGIALLGKEIVQFVVGLFYGVAAFAGVIVGGAGVIALSGKDPALGEVETWQLVGRGLLAMALWAVIGVGVGALIRNQVAAIVLILVVAQFIEPTLRLVAMFNDFTARFAEYLPGAASDALTGASFFTSLGVDGMGATSAGLTPLAGGLVLLAYALVAGLAGYWFSWRRDVT